MVDDIDFDENGGEELAEEDYLTSGGALLCREPHEATKFRNSDGRKYDLDPGLRTTKNKTQRMVWPLLDPFNIISFEVSCEEKMKHYSDGTNLTGKLQYFHQISRQDLTS